MKTTHPKRIAALLADAFQEEEFFLPKVALARAGYTVDVVSIERRPIEMYSYFAQTGLLNVDRAVTGVDPADYAGILVAGGAKSPALLAESEAIKAFVRTVNASGGIVSSICRGTLLLIKSDIARGRRVTGFNDAATYPDLCVEPHAIEAGAIWIDGKPVVVDGNLISSPHPDHADEFGQELVRALGLRA
jgi:protease I